MDVQLELAGRRYAESLPGDSRDLLRDAAVGTGDSIGPRNVEMVTGAANSTNSRAVALVVALLFVPRDARADREELYTLVEVSPLVMRLDTPVAASTASTSASGIAAGATVYYGLTNTVHVGAAVHYEATRNAAFEGTTVTLNGGTSSHGTLYEDTSAISLTMVGAYRFDLGPRLVPVAQLELGVASLSYSNIAHFDASTGVAFPYSDRSQKVFEVRGQLRAEYRFGDHFVGGAGVGVLVHPGALNPWSLYLPVSVGYVW